MKCENAAVNLGPLEKRKRLLLGIGMFLLAAGLGIYFVFQEISVSLRIIIFPLFFIAILGFLQAKERTCVFLAYKKNRNLDSGEESISDYKISNYLIIKSQKMILQAFFLAALLTLACVFI